MKSKIKLSYILLPVILLITNNCPVKSNIATGQTMQLYQQNKSENTIGYLLYLPGDYYKSKDKKYPLIFFLHGTGEQGTNLLLIKKTVLPKMLEAKSNFPFIVVSPQYQLDKNYDTFSGISIDNFGEFYDHIIKKYKVDTDKVYLTGLSFGGYLTWNIAIKYPDKFAAIAPLCGFGSKEDLYKYHTLPSDLINIKNIPVWVFHGEKDDVVPVIQSEVIVNELKKYSGKVEFTTYPDLKHDCWTVTYNNDKLYEWFLKNKK